MAPQNPPGRHQRPAPGLPPQMRQRAPQRPARGSSPVRLIGYAMLGVACLALAAVSFVFIAAPVDLVRDRMVEEVKARTGRDLVVSGPVAMALFPSPGVTISGVTLSDGPGQTGTLLTVERISAQVSLSDLLARRVHVRRVVLSAPTLALRVDARGRRNWDFAEAESPAPARIRYAQARGPVMRDAPASAGPAGPAAFNPAPLREALAQVLPGEVRIERGTLSYRDQRTGDELDVSGIDLEAASASLDAPLEAKGTFTLRGQPLAYSARISSLDAALSSGNADLVVKAEGAPLSADFQGRFALPPTGPQLDGKLALKSASIPALGLWLGRPVAMDGPTDLSFAGRVQLGRGQLSLPDFESVLAGRPAKGALAVDFNPRRPKITGQLQVASLDLGALLLRHPADAAPASPGAAPKADPIGDILRQQQQRTPQVRGFTQRKGGARDWSDERLDVRLLALADADLRISAGQVLHHDLKTGPGRVAITLMDRNLRVDLEDIALYGGRGRGVATVDAAGATPAMSLNLTLDGVSAGPLLKDAADFEWLDGRTNVAVVLAGQGFSERELVETLSGTVEMKTLNGQLSGLNLPKLIRSLEMGQIPNVQIQPSEKTPFSELAGTFVIAKGVAQNNDLRLITANARLSGTGVVQLPARTLAYDVRAKVSGTGASPQQGAVVNFSNIEIPLRIEGPWDKPVIGLKGQEQIVESIKQIGKNLKNPEVQDVLRGLLGGGGDKSVKPGDLLNRLLKKE